MRAVTDERDIPDAAFQFPEEYLIPNEPIWKTFGPWGAATSGHVQRYEETAMTDVQGERSIMVRVWWREGHEKEGNEALQSLMRSLMEFHRKRAED